MNNSNDFAKWFNVRCPGAYRKITGEDVRDLVACGLIHRYGHYSRVEDGKIILAILQYEHLREHRSDTEDKEKNFPICKRCGQLFTQKLGSKNGRPKEYCTDCEGPRNRERQKLSRERRRKLNLKRSVGSCKN